MKLKYRPIDWESHEQTTQPQDMTLPTLTSTVSPVPEPLQSTSRPHAYFRTVSVIPIPSPSRSFKLLLS
jgi:hypothetical protein